MKKFFKFASLFTPLALFVAALASVGFTSASSMALAESDAGAATTSEAVSIPENETLVDPSMLHISITSSSTTDKSHSIGARFSSLIQTFQNQSREQNLYFSIEDESYDEEAETSPIYDDDGKTLIGPVYNASCYAMYNTKTNFSNVVIPSTITRDKGFILNITSIAGGCAPTNAGTANRDKAYTNVASIIIPSTITTIYKNAFTEVPDEVTIKCEATERPDGWDEEWTDAKNIEWGYTLSDSEVKRLNQNGGLPKAFASSNTYIIGSHYEEEPYYQPLLATYSIINDDGSLVSADNVIEIPLTSTNTPYDSVGGATTSLGITFDIEKEKGQKIDVDSIVFHNIYLSTRATFSDGSEKIAPDLTEVFYGVPTISYSDELDITDLINFRTSMVSTYVGYLDINLSVDKVLYNGADLVYEKLMPTIYAENKENIANGTHYIRYLFNGLNQTYYRITYQSGSELVTTSVKISSPVDHLIITNDSGNYAGFSLKMSDIADDFTYESIVSVELIGLRVKLDIYNIDTAKSVNKSDFSRRFGVIDLYEKDAGVSYTSVETMVGMWIGIYAALFIAGAAAYYFYCKNRFKNDEFRRVDDKKFVIAAAKNLVGFGLIALAILYNVARWCIMNTSVVAFNPVDAYLIVFTVAGAIFLGFFIKGLVNSIKDGMKRRKDAKLHLDQDVAEDGTN